jgi:ubiquinone/menaquinone biosynthesis C-methylase UbiE
MLASVDRNRIKFFFAGPLIDAVNAHIPGRPHLQLSELVPGNPGEVLDLCSGTGYVARLVAAAHPKASVVALDASPEMLEVGERRAVAEGLGVRFLHGDAAQLPFGDDSVDVVTAAFALHELPRRVRERAIGELCRVLKRRGRLLCMDLDQRDPSSKLVDFYLRAFERADARDVLDSGLVRQLTDAGFTIAEHRSHLGRLPAYQLIDARWPT